MIQKFKSHTRLYWCWLIWLTTIIACQPVYDEETDEQSSASQSSLKVLTRSSNDTNILYPACIYAFNEKGECASSQIVTGSSTPIEMKLAPASYTLVAIAGYNEDYVLPEHPKLNDVIAMRLGNRSGRALMMGRATVTVQSGKSSKNTVTITLYHVVSLVNVTLEGIGNDVKKVKLKLSPIYSTLTFNGEYGKRDQATEVDCTLESEGVWVADPFYVFPGSASQTVFTITLENSEGLHTYGYTFNGRPQANVPFNINGCFKGDVFLEGTLVPSDWNSPIEARFDFGESEIETKPGSSHEIETPDTSELPAIGSIWNEGIVVSHTKPTQETTEILLMSLLEWSALTAQVNEILQTKEAAGWHLPQSDEAHTLHKALSGTMLETVNQNIAKHNPNLPLIDIKKRFLYNNSGSLFTFSFKPTTRFILAGKTVKYKMRLVRTLSFQN